MNTQALANLMGFDLSLISEQVRFAALDCSQYPLLYFDKLKLVWPYSGRIVNLQPIGCNGYIKGFLVYALSPDDYCTFEFYPGDWGAGFGSIRFSANDVEDIEELFSGIYIKLDK